MVESWWNHKLQWNHGGIMVESWWNHGVESHLRRSFCDSTMIPLQIYDSTKTTIIPLVELWWNYRGGITKIVSESSTTAGALWPEVGFAFRVFVSSALCR